MPSYTGLDDLKAPAPFSPALAALEATGRSRWMVVVWSQVQQQQAGKGQLQARIEGKGRAGGGRSTQGGGEDSWQGRARDHSRRGRDYCGTKESVALDVRVRGRGRVRGRSRLEARG